LKLLLNQDDPALLTRLMAYYDRFSTAQADAITELRTALQRLDEIRLATDQELVALDAVKAEHQATDQRLAVQREERQQLVSALDKQIGSDDARLQELQRDRADLETLLERLSDALADIPSDLGAGEHPTARRGQLPMPVSGRVLHAFGQTRTAGLAWQGWLVEAPRGAEIRAVAYGRVAYADWLRGYGLLLIIDHGEGFMSLYGNNESLLFEVGQWVQAGSVIATVGAYPETGPGLYFELRHGGRAVDPAAWVKR
jgi:septal ring factor EnvC (AmiA/AmiB activator)